LAEATPEYGVANGFGIGSICKRGKVGTSPKE
jgi:hypothetical protein